MSFYEILCCLLCELLRNCHRKLVQQIYVLLWDLWANIITIKLQQRWWLDLCILLLRSFETQCFIFWFSTKLMNLLEKYNNMSLIFLSFYNFSSQNLYSLSIVYLLLLCKKTLMPVYPLSILKSCLLQPATYRFSRCLDSYWTINDMSSLVFVRYKSLPMSFL